MADLLCPVVIGRSAETGALRSALAAAREGAGAVVFLTGEAGIGKSRLAGELAAEARADGVRVLTGRAVPASEASPYRPLTEALLQALRGHPLPDDDGLAPWRPALRAIIRAIAPTIAGHDGDGHGDHSPAVRGEAVLQLLRRLAGPAGLLLVLEDLHWADPDTLAVVEYLSDNLSAEPVLCVATCRGEPASAAAELIARLHGRRAASRIALGRLSADEVAAMVRACLPAAGDDVLSRVQRLAEGVPFLVEESLAAPGVPRSFADGIRARLAAVGDEERLVLYTAALFGRQFDWRLLPAATGLPADVVAGALEGGVASQLLAVDGDAFRFRHMLTREAVAAEVLPPRRVALAARALAALEAAHPDLPGASGDLAADLAIQGGDPGRAGTLLLASGRSALGRGALATAIGTLRRAAELLADLDQRDEAETLLVEGLALAGRVDEAMRIGDRLIAQHVPGGAATRRAAIHLKLAHAGAGRLTEAKRIAGELGAASTGAVIDLQLTATAIFRFELDEAERCARSGLAASTRLGLAMTSAIVLVFLAEVYALRREPAEMERFIALACAAAPGDAEVEGSALAGARGMLALLNGDLADALDALGRGMAILDAGPQRGPAPYRGMWALLLAARGDARATAAIGHARAIGLTVNRANRGLLGYADAILAGRAGDGSRATDLAAAADDDLQYYPVWADLARLCAAEPALADGWGRPRQWLEASAGVFARYGIEPLAARCRQLLDGPRPSRWSRLGITERQADVLRLVAAGISNKEIAARLHLSPRTVEKHVENLLRITAAQSRTQLVAIAGPESD